MSRRPATPKKITSVGEFTVGEPFGEGNYGIIRLGRRKDGEQVVIKELDVAEGSVLDDVRREGNIMSLLDHELVISLYEQRLIGDRVFLVMEFAKGGDLLDLIMGSPNGRLPVEEAKRIFAQLVLATEYMHERGVIHRDLKPDNIFLDDRHNIRVGDFGLSVLFSKDEPSLTARAGTLHYASPETFLGSKIYGPELDVWSIGVVLYVMMHGRYPFWGKNDTESAKAILSATPKYPRHFPIEAVQLLQAIFIKAPFQRVSISQIKKHPWIRGEILRQSRQLALENVREVKRVLSFQGTSRRDSSSSLTTDYRIPSGNDSDESDTETDSETCTSPTPEFESHIGASSTQSQTGSRALAPASSTTSAPATVPSSREAAAPAVEKEPVPSSPPTGAKTVIAMRPPTKKSAVIPKVSTIPSTKSGQRRTRDRKGRGDDRADGAEEPKESSNGAKESGSGSGRKDAAHAKPRSSSDARALGAGEAKARGSSEQRADAGSDDGEKRKHEKVRLKQWAMERVRERKKNRKGRSASMSATLPSEKGVTFASDTSPAFSASAADFATASATSSSGAATSSASPPSAAARSSAASSTSSSSSTTSMTNSPRSDRRRLSLLRLHKFKACVDLHAANSDR